MRAYLTVGALAAFCLAMAGVLWIGAVPHVLSGAAFAWTMGIALFLTTFTAVFIVRARPTRAIAHVLYDVEHPGKKL